jgi:hypothetical protein
MMICSHLGGYWCFIVLLGALEASYSLIYALLTAGKGEDGSV